MTHFLKQFRAVKTLMPRVIYLLLFVAAASAATVFGQAPATGVTVFEGARVIVGDGRAPIENASFIVDGTRFVQVGSAADVRAPAAATHVSLAGKTVMPAIIDTHTHLSQTRELLIDDLRRRAYFGIGAALSLGQDTTDAPFQVRAQTMPGVAKFFTAGRGITAPEPGRTTAPYWVTTTAEARKAVQDDAAKKVDIIKIWVDDRMGTVKKLSPDEPNNSADFIVLNANPLDDITNTRKISSVYLRGGSVDRSSYK